MKKTVNCPVTGKQIDGDSCYCVVLVVDGEAPEQALPPGVTLTDDARTACLACQYHEDEQ